MDITEYTATCAKRFCPEYGMAIIRNKRGQPKSFCSDRCRWAFDKRSKRIKAKEVFQDESSRTEGTAGVSAEAVRV